MLWERRYQKVISYQDRHDLTDMAITSDGGIVGVMSALDYNEEVPEVGHPQRAWISKYRDWETDRKSTRLNSSH